VNTFLDNKLTLFYVFVTCTIIWTFKVLLMGINTFPSGDNLTYAAIGRSIVENFSISHISALPSDIKALGDFPQYDVSQNLGLPIFLVPFFIIFGSNNLAIMISSFALYVINALLTFVISLKLFDKQIAILATYLFVFSSSYYNYINSGLTEPLLILLLLIVGYIQFFITNKYKGILVGVLIYALYLTKSGLAIFIFPYFIVHWVLYEGRSLQYIFGIGFMILLLSIPLVLRNSLLDLSTFSEKSGMIDLLFNASRDKGIWYFGLRSIDVPAEWLDPTKYLFDNYQFYIKKYASTLYALYLKTHGANYLFSGSIIFWAYLLSQSKNINENTFRLFTIGIFVLLIFGFSIGWPIERYLLPIVPFLLIAISAYAVPRITNFKKSYILIILLIGMQTPWFGFVVRDLYVHGDKVNYAELGEFVKNNTKDEDIIISNTPGLVGWYSNRRSVLYPNRISDIQSLNNMNSNINTIVLTEDLHRLFRNNDSQAIWDYTYVNRVEKIEDVFCLIDIFQNKNETYAALLYRSCDK
jgi:hypothetical protein